MEVEVAAAAEHLASLQDRASQNKHGWRELPFLHPIEREYEHG